MCELGTAHRHVFGSLYSLLLTARIRTKVGIADEEQEAQYLAGFNVGIH